MSKTATIIDTALLDSVTAQAEASPRRRKNHNFHPVNEFPCHRLLNAIEPDSYVPPHCHAAAAKDETILALRGRMGLVFFDAAGTVTAKALIEPGGAAVAVDIPHGLFHTIVALQPGCVFFEAKAGPYEALTPAERAPWAPGEGEAGAMEYLEGLQRLFQ
ncbi:MAG: WbuC family cupin fold metalloprotein [Sulfuricella sp.]|nr:WbuC family cupin fold metalloprotein [Sulfuricella sp.]